MSKSLLLRPIILKTVGLSLMLGASLTLGQAKPAAADRIDVAAIYFPGFHRDIHYDAWFGEGWNEWALLAEAPLRFAGQHFFRPQWGPFDEADPKWMERQMRWTNSPGV